MADLVEKHEKTQMNTGGVREGSEYVRLVISDEPSTTEAESLQPQAPKKRSYTWWIKAMTWCFSTIVVLLIFLKWGVPFLFEKVMLWL